MLYIDTRLDRGFLGGEGRRWREIDHLAKKSSKLLSLLSFLQIVYDNTYLIKSYVLIII